MADNKSTIKKTQLENLYSKVYKDGDNFKHKIAVNLVNFSGSYKDKNGNDVEFSSDKLQLVKVKLDFKSGEEKHKGFTGKDGTIYTKPDKTEFFIEKEELEDILNNLEF